MVYDRNPRSIVVEADIIGGGTPVPRDAHVPLFRLYGDGFLVFAGNPAPLSTGLDATARTGHLTDADIQHLLALLRDGGFNSLNGYYEPRPVPPGLETATIDVYQSKLKSVSVYGPKYPGMPKVFLDALERITSLVPQDATNFVPASGYLLSTPAGSVTEVKSLGELPDWPSSTGVKLADATNGITVAGNTYANIAANVARAFPRNVFREGSSVYSVRFAPDLPRAIHLTNWLGSILQAPREFEGRAFDIVGYYRGANLYGEARGNATTKSDWVIADDSGAMFVSGLAPTGLDPNSRVDAWTVVRLRAVVVYVRNGTSHLEARRVDNLTTGVPATPTPTAISDAASAISAAQARFPDLGQIKSAKAGVIGASTDITVLERAESWELVFWSGSDDCPSGCINNRYTYITVTKDGRVTKAGEYSRIFNSATNKFDTVGAPLWGVPK